MSHKKCHAPEMTRGSRGRDVRPEVTCHAPEITWKSRRNAGNHTHSTTRNKIRVQTAFNVKQSKSGKLQVKQILFLEGAVPVRVRHVRVGVHHTLVKHETLLFLPGDGADPLGGRVAEGCQHQSTACRAEGVPVHPERFAS